MMVNKFDWVFETPILKNKTKFIESFKKAFLIPEEINSLDTILTYMKERNKFASSIDIQFTLMNLGEFIERNTIKNKKAITLLSNIKLELKKYMKKNNGKTSAYLGFKRIKKIYGKDSLYIKSSI